MDQRKKVILIIAAILVLVGILAFFLRSGSEGPTVAPSATGEPVSGPAGTLTRSGGVAGSGSGASAVPAEPLPAPPASVAVRQIAMTFTERFGSFSSEGEYVNLTDLYPLMTERYQRQTEAEVARLRARPPATAFAATSTVVISTDVDLPSGEASTSATARVTTQRTAVDGTQAPRTYGQEIMVKLLKVGEEWKVDGANWSRES
ncbi:hypothetical protein HY634_00960 [Candidatus Uhrbacteria bacterium]|nr:hypothetical protein [Candidatus Uhrbacteria bacterium]